MKRYRMMNFGARSVSSVTGAMSRGCRTKRILVLPAAPRSPEIYLASRQARSFAAVPNPPANSRLIRCRRSRLPCGAGIQRSDSEATPIAVATLGRHRRRSVAISGRRPHAALANRRADYADFADIAKARELALMGKEAGSDFVSWRTWISDWTISPDVCDCRAVNGRGEGQPCGQPGGEPRPLRSLRISHRPMGYCTPTGRGAIRHGAISMGAQSRVHLVRRRVRREWRRTPPFRGPTHVERDLEAAGHASLDGPRARSRTGTG